KRFRGLGGLICGAGTAARRPPACPDHPLSSAVREPAPAPCAAASTCGHRTGPRAGAPAAGTAAPGPHTGAPDPGIAGSPIPGAAGDGACSRGGTAPGGTYGEPGSARGTARDGPAWGSRGRGRDHVRAWGGASAAAATDGPG